MSRKSVFVKVSGDLCLLPEFVARIEKIAREYFVVICVGGGTQINKGFEKAGIALEEYGPLGRETKTFEERQLARDILEVNQARLQDHLAKEKITATVIIPVLDIGSVLCHVNGDQMVRTCYLGFDHLFVMTTPDRLEQKKKDFAGLPKVQVLSFG